MNYQLESNWLSIITAFGDALDLTYNINIPLKKVIEFIISNNEISLTQRYAQLAINHILFDKKHPFFYLSDIPIDLMKSAFDEVYATSLPNVEFSKKMDSTIKELQASQQLVKFGFNHNEKIPQKQIEDDFYLVDDNDKPYAFEVKSKLENEYFSNALENHIRGKMYFHNFKKYIGIGEININEKNFKQYLEVIDSKILVDSSIVDTIHFENKECFDIGSEKFCNSKSDNVSVETQLKDDEFWIRYTSENIKFELNVRENFEDQDVSLVSVRTGFCDFFKKEQDNKNIIELEFENYLKGKLEDIKKQYLKPKKLLYRKNDIFGGFVYLHIPWNWDWKKKSISKSFEQLVSKLMNNLDIRFPIYFYLYKNEKQNILVEILIKYNNLKSTNLKKKKRKRK